jgi:hypothetical protein
MNASNSVQTAPPVLTRTRVPGGGFRIVRREVIVDQSALGVPNLSVFL